MDIEISNRDRSLKVSGIQCQDPADCMSHVLGLWEGTNEAAPETGGAMGFHSENTYQNNKEVVALDIDQLKVT